MKQTWNSVSVREAKAYDREAKALLNNVSRGVYQEALSGHPTLSPYNFHTNTYYTKRVYVTIAYIL